MPDMSMPRDILVFLPNWVGDVVMATPVLRSLRLAAPDARIMYFGRIAPVALLVGNEWADMVLLDESNRRPRWLQFLRTRKRLHALGADVALLMPNSFRSALLARLAGVPRRIGYARDGRGWMLTDRLKPHRDETRRYLPEPMIDYYARLLEPLGASLDDRVMRLPTTPKHEHQADAMLREAGYRPARPLVMLNPGGSFGPSKQWMPDRYAAVADALKEEYGAQIIVNAAPNPSEQQTARSVVSQISGGVLLDFSQHKNNLGLLKGLAARCDLLITNDTGARHVAAAMGSSVVTIFGSTDPVWAQIDYPRERTVRVEVPCGPCQKKQCPLSDEHERCRCLRAVTVNMVLAAARDLLGSGGGA